MSSIKDAMRVIAAEKRIEELCKASMALCKAGTALREAVELLNKRVTELDEKLDAMIAVNSQPRPAQTLQPRPNERR